jgi:uncharacterized RDD family membrane protein YckC
MNCPNCSREIVADRRFCMWCESFVARPSAGRKASVLRRWVASVIDPLLFIVVYLVAAGVAGVLSGGLAVLAVLALAVYQCVLFSRGTTFGKLLLGERVARKADGAPPGFLRMLARETVGKFVSGLFFGLGFFWAIWDRDNQAWHDKIVGTVVLKKPEGAPAPATAPGLAAGL